MLRDRLPPEWLRPCSGFAAALLWAAAGYAYLVSGARLGIELSDSSFYVLNNLYGADIAIELRQFGVIWQALFGIKNIVAGRIVNISLQFAVTFIASYWLLQAIARRHADRLAPVTIATLALLITPTSAIFFESHLLDFSYNSASYLFFALIVASVLQLSRTGTNAPQALPRTRLKQLAFAALLGFAFFGMGLVKPQTALLTALVCLGTFLLVERRAWPPKELVLVTAGFAVGCLVFVALLARLVSPIALSQHMIDGYLGLKLLGAQKATLGAEAHKLLRFIDKLASAPMIFLGKAPLIAAPSLLLVASAFAYPRLGRWLDSKQLGKKRLGKSWLNWALVGLLLVLIAGILDLDAKHLPRIYAFAFVCLLALALACLLAIPRARRSRTLFWLLPTGMGFAFLLFLSTNDWYGAHHRAIAFSILAVAALVMLLPQERRLAGIMALLAIIALYSLPTIKRHEARPYRLGAPLNQARVVVDFGPELGRLKVPPRAAQAYLALAELQAAIASLPTDQRPSLIDMTGRAPGFALYLGLRPPATSWIASGYPGSDDFLAYTLDKMGDETKRRAYVVVADEALESGGTTAKNLSAEVLNQRLAAVGQSFPRDYQIVGKGENPHTRQAVTFYSPKP